MVDPRELAPLLLRWYDQHGRSLPWRGSKDLYAILVSELMLQQTRVDTVLRYYEPFLERFPDLARLAEASEEEVMAAWSGLGFYRRARNLHRAARQILSEHGGEVPTDAETLQELPGIGRYTAGAILSSGRNARLPILDGNVIRVLSRVFSISEPPDRAATQARLWQLAEEILPTERPGDFNQAIMDLGATLCSPTGPDCPTCPFSAPCTARAEGAAEDYPRPTRKTKIKFEERVAVFLERADGRFLLQRRSPEGLLASLWELPAAVVGEGETALDIARQVGGGGVLAPCPTVEHRFSHRHWTIRVFRAAGPQAPQASTTDPSREELWVHPEELAELGIPTVTRKTIRAALGG
ncbi:MAG: A/G-specific adenine glycosylase [Myxococcota bacterium]|nr:A/G-specific adenine glycosylase [Myxococcota bacterium]